MAKKQPKKPAKLPPITGYDKRLAGGRYSLSPRTDDPKVRVRREAGVLAALQRGASGVAAVERLRSGGLHISDFEAALRTGDWSAVESAPPEPAPEAEEDVAPVGELPPLRMADELEAYIAGAAVRKSSRLQYEAKARVTMRHFGDDCLMRSVTTEKAERFLKGHGWAPRTQSDYAKLLNGCWKHVIHREQEAAHLDNREPRLVLNPWRRSRREGGLRLDKIPRKPRHAWFRPEQWAELSRRTTGTPRRAMYALGTLAGLRQQEVANLRPGVDLILHPEAGGELIVQARSGEGVLEWEAKTDNSYTTMPILPGSELDTILRDHVRLGYAGARYFIRAGRRDTPPSHSTFADWFRSDVVAMGLRYGRGEGDSLTYHSTRHTFASWMLQRSVDLMTVAELMRDTPDMIVFHYGHLMPKNLEAGLRTVDRTARGDETDEVSVLRQQVAELTERLEGRAA